mmetsp:Transcript_21447/g.35509  ORF Transcript_21447/g.35509 Transcript_21447/m.35509 type:complete len:96 (-) Transcript_21447:789-1076(-)
MLISSRILTPSGGACKSIMVAWEEQTQQIKVMDAQTISITSTNDELYSTLVASGLGLLLVKRSARRVRLGGLEPMPVVSFVLRETLDVLLDDKRS